MKKFLLAAFMLFDVLLIGASGYVLFTYLNHHLNSPFGKPGVVPVVAVHPAVPSVPVSTSAVTTPGIAVAAPAAGAESMTRKMLFTYRSPRAHQVAIRADFTGWKAEPMQKDANGLWTYMAVLSPGEYAYCFTADDKTFKDPANKRTKQIGRTMVSAIVVGALPPKAAK